MASKSASDKPCPRGKKTCPIYDDVARLRRENEELKETIRTDHLTGLYNVRHLHDALEQEMERTKRTLHPTALIILDLDHFKSVNDTHGHVVGDQALKHIADIIRSTTRKLDIPCRHGGEEFAIVLPSTPHLPAIQVARRIRENVEQSSLALEGEELFFTVSIGLDTYSTRSRETVQEFIDRTDKLLYEAKASGRNRVVYAGPSDDPGKVGIEEKAALFGVADTEESPIQIKKPKSNPKKNGTIMLKVNEYFDGQVKSIAFDTNTLPATIGVMAKGEYTFGTDCKEVMEVVCGELIVQLPGSDEWKSFINGQVFEVEANQSFCLKVPVDTAYLCKYIR